MSYKKYMIAGAAVGFALAMFKRKERQQFVNDSKAALQQLKFIYDHPTNIIDELQHRLRLINNRTIKVIDQLDQLEELFNKDHKKL